MRINREIRAALAKAELTDSYRVEQAKLDLALALERYRRKVGLSYEDFADKVGVPPAYIAKVFRGEANVTIETMVKLARATGANLHIELCDQAVDPQRWAKLAKSTMSRQMRCPD